MVSSKANGKRARSMGKHINEANIQKQRARNKKRDPFVTNRPLQKD